MNAGLNPYVEFKQSGISWLGNIPRHWQLKRPKQLFCKMARPVRDCDEVVTCFRDGVVTLRKNRRLLGFTESLKEIGYQGVRQGDLVIHGMDAFAGSIGVSESDGKATPVYSVCAPIGTHVNSHYYAYCVREMARAGWIAALAKGIRERSTDFRFDVFGTQGVPYPSLKEQTAIARFLDHVDRRIQKYIRAKEKLIALLDEYKQALIHQAVTGQIDVRTGEPYPEYKESGVEWLGSVPRHWETRRLQSVAEMRVSNVDKHSKEGEAAVRLCNYVDVYHHDRIHPKLPFMEATATPAEIRKFRLQCNDVLITKDSETWDDIGVPALVGDVGPDILSGYHLALLRPNVKLMTGGYLFQALQIRGVAAQLHVSANGVTRYGLSKNGIKSTLVPLPPLPEQTTIVRFLDLAGEAIDSVVAAQHRQVDFTNEYRPRLIADVVTGKLDVRDAAAGLPDVDSVNYDGSSYPLNQIEACDLDEATTVASSAAT